MRELTLKTFDSEQELAAMKIELANLEQEISRNIVEKQKETETVDLFPEDLEAEEVIYSAPKR